MELDDMKLAWQTLDRRLEQQNALQFNLFRDSKLAKMRSGLRWLATGQSIQIAAGALLMLLFAPFWVEHRTVPHLLLYGLSLHAYGLMFVAFAARDLHLIGRIDYAAPVLAIQKQIAELRAWRMHSGMWFALTGCIVWMPLMLVIFYWLGADIWVAKPQVVYWFIANSVVAALLAVALFRWTRHPKRAQRMGDSAAGRSVMRAQAVLDEIARFERP